MAGIGNGSIASVKHVERKDASVWKQRPRFLIARITSQLGSSRRPRVRTGVVQIGIGAGKVPRKNFSVWQNDRRIIAEMRLRKWCDGRPGIVDRIVDFR